MLNDKKLSALRSGNISVRHNNGFLITPSGKKYSSLKVKDIVFVSLDGKYEKKYKQGWGSMKKFIESHPKNIKFNIIEMPTERQE